MSHGIKESKELLKFVIEFGEALEQALKEDGLGIADIGLFMAPLMQVGAAFEGIAMLGDEAKDYSAEEVVELVAYAKTELNLDNAKTEKVVEDALELGVKIYAFIQLFKKVEEVADTGTGPVAPAATTGTDPVA